MGNKRTHGQAFLAEGDVGICDYATATAVGIGGLLKVMPTDFRVNEIDVGGQEVCGEVEGEGGRDGGAAGTPGPAAPATPAHAWDNESWPDTEYMEKFDEAGRSAKMGDGAECCPDTEDMAACEDMYPQA